VGTEECFQCGHHVAGGDILQVEDGQESVDGGDTAQVAGEDDIYPRPPDLVITL